MPPSTTSSANRRRGLTRHPALFVAQTRGMAAAIALSQGIPPTREKYWAAFANGVTITDLETRPITQAMPALRTVGGLYDLRVF